MKKLPFFYKIENNSFKFEKKEFSRELFLRLYFFLIFVVVLIFFLRLFQLTIVKGFYYRQLSENNRLRELIIEAQRGKIKDRKGLTLAFNQPADINKNEPRLKSKRIYHEPEIIAPVVGYRQIADKNDLKNDPCLENRLVLGDKTGKKGVEKLFDCQLRGKNGKKLIEVDAKGNFLKELSVIAPIEGKTIQLALDFDLQKKAADLLKEKKGAIIALKAKTNEVLVLYSSPSFSPQDFEEGNIKNIKAYEEDKNHPLFNRALEGLYPPGSIFKLVVATAALEEKTIDEQTLIEDTGVLQAGPLKFGNWYFLQYGKTDGLVDIVKGIRRSNDIFFYKIGEKTGVEKIKKWAEKLGLGKKTGIGLPEEEGLIPSVFWKQAVLKDQWYLGDTYNFSIGQGYILTTPIQLAVLTSVFANDGYLCQPKLLKMENNFSMEKNCQKLSISHKTLSLIKEGMKQACSPGGTGWPLFEFKVQSAKFKVEEKEASLSAQMTKIQTACKTGTAESQSKDHLPHAWITVFAPYENPEIILTVLVENGGQGSDVAGPIAKEMLKEFFEKR
jgi:penicillin-binding protein 2